MGKWGNFFQRGKWDSRGYARQTRKLVKSVSASGEITWGYSSRKHKRDITQGIQISDVRWLVPWLARITDQDLHAGLMASGALPENVETFTQSVAAGYQRQTGRQSEIYVCTAAAGAGRIA